MPAQLGCGVHRNSSEGVSRRRGSPFHEWTPGCRRELPDRTRLHRADNGKLLSLRYSGSCRSAHTLLCKRFFHLPLWPLRQPLTITSARLNSPSDSSTPTTKGGPLRGLARTAQFQQHCSTVFVSQTPSAGRTKQ